MIARRFVCRCSQAELHRGENLLDARAARSLVPLMMAKQPSKVEIVREGEERILLRQYVDGTEERTPIVREPKKVRRSSRPYWYWELATGRRKFF
jgi:hypothetical protein